LASDPDASMSAIARRAGVVRATVYVHFPTREALLDAVTERAISNVTAVIEAAEPQAGKPAAALRRVLEAAWHSLGQYHSLVAINTRLPAAELHRRHMPVLQLLEPLIRRGQRDGTFRKDVSPSWHLSMTLALVHAASSELNAERVPSDQIESALIETVLGAVTKH
jgi:AcrR family transcriptional regulator